MVDDAAAYQWIETARLKLRPRNHSDYDACLEMDKDPAVTKYVDGPWRDPAAHRAFLNERFELRLPPPLGYWSVFSKIEPSAFLGWVMLLPDNDKIAEVEIGWRFARAAWGFGYATEAASCLVRRFRDSTDGATLSAHIHPENAGSINVAEKIGMTRARVAQESVEAEQLFILHV